MSNSYGWAEIIPEIIEEVDWSKFSEDRMAEIEECMDTHVSMADEVDSYRYPSSSDMMETALHRQEQQLKQNFKHETDWRDKRIKELESANQRLWNRIDDLEDRL